MKIDAQSFMQKKIICSLLATFLTLASYKGQRHEIGMQFGMSNLVGDIGRTNYILQKPIFSSILSDYGIPFYGGLLYRMNFNPYQTARFNFGYSHIQFVDAVAKEQYRRNRKLWGTNSIVEADLLFEYNFFPVNNEQKSMASPYIFAGIGGMLTNTNKVTLENDFRRNAAGVAQTPTDNADFVVNPTYQTGKKMTMSIPFGIGLKYKFNYNWALFGELMFRPTFSDAVDYSMIDAKDVKSTYNKDILMPGEPTKSLLEADEYKEAVELKKAQFLTDRQIGNINSKDWVNTISVGLTYSFGRPPCYCEQ